MMVDMRDRTFWYPTVRLFRQSIAGDWNSVMNEVAEKLNLLFPTHD